MDGEPIVTPPRTGRMGVSAASLVFEAWGWLFREQPIEDYGIDAHVEPLDGPEQPSRQLLALQIKTGASFFREETPDGWWFRDTRRHWHYWLGHVLPVVIVLYDPQTGVLYWQHVEADLVRLTGGEGKLLIPRSQVLDSAGAGRDRLRQIVRDFRQADPLADSLPLLPPSAAGVLRATTARPENTTMLAFQLASGRHQPELTAASLLAGQPSWLSDGGGQFEAAIGAYANDHGHRDIARRAFELAAAYDRPDRGRLLSIAALLAVAGDDLEGAEADLARIPDPDGLFPRLGRAAIADHARPDGAAEGGEMNQLLREADPADLAGEPTLLSVLAGLAVRRGDLEEAIRLFELAAAADPPYPAGRLQLARALLARAVAGTSVLAHQDLGRARRLALESLEDMRRWSGPSEEQWRSCRRSPRRRARSPRRFGSAASPAPAGRRWSERPPTAGWRSSPLRRPPRRATASARPASPRRRQTPPQPSTSRRSLSTPAGGPPPSRPPGVAPWPPPSPHEQIRRALYQLAAVGQLVPTRTSPSPRDAERCHRRPSRC